MLFNELTYMVFFKINLINEKNFCGTMLLEKGSREISRRFEC